MKKYMRILALVLCLCMVLAIAVGCGDSSDTSSGSESSSSAPVSDDVDESAVTTTTTTEASADSSTTGTQAQGSTTAGDKTTASQTKSTTRTTVATASPEDGWSSGNSGSEKKLFDKRTGVKDKVTLFIPWDTSADSTFQEIKSGFEKEYKTKVKVITGEWGTRDIKLVQLIRSGTSPDYVPTGVFDFPRRAIKGLLQPLDDLIQESSTLDEHVMNNITVWEGKKYAVIGKRNPGVLYYNKTMLKNAMITDTPAKLAAANKWTWNDLKNMARKLTVDSNRDGKPDVYGFGTELEFIFPLSKGTDIVKLEKGKPTLNIDDEDWRSALLFYYDGVNKDKIFTPVRWSIWEEFANGNVAMYYGTAGEAEKILNKGMKDWDIAPFPKPDATAGSYVGYNSSDGFGVAVGAANPIGGMAFGEYQYNYYTQKSMKGESKSLFTKEQQKIFDSLENRVTLLYGYGMEDTFCQAFGNYMRKNGDFTALMEEMRPIWQKNLDDTLKGR